METRADVGSVSTKQQVFEAIRAQGHVSRVDISKYIGVSAGSVTSATAELISAGLVRESTGQERDQDAGRGRPPVSLSVRADSNFVIGVKLSTPHHSAVVMDMAGGIRAEVILPCSARRQGVDAICDFVDTLVTTALDRASLSAGDVTMVGVGLPGFVDHETGEVEWSPLLRDQGVPLRQAITARMNMPVELDNDANLLTLAELWFGAGRSMRDFAVVTIEHGVGMGLVINNQLYRGAQGMGMELGHTKVQLDGALCRCGQRGCLEAYVADYALAREASTALNMETDDDGTTTVMNMLLEQANDGNEAAQSIFRRAGRYLALGLANVVNMFDPSLIILSGDRMRYDYLYAQEVVSDMIAMTPNTRVGKTRIEAHQWGDLVWAKGAAALALSATTDRLFAAGHME